jgi:hypothetical protein
MTNREKEIRIFKRFIKTDLYKKGFRQCSQCYQVKSLEDFYADSRRKQGKAADCKECHDKVTKANERRYTFYVSDHYVKKYAVVVLSTKYGDFPSEALETVRQQILTSRKLKQIKNEKKIK